MAIIHGIKGLEVTIEVNGVTAKEYHDPDEDERGDLDLDTPPGVHIRAHQVKYIEVTPGASFQFRVKRGRRFRHRSDHIGYLAYADGMAVGICHDDTPNNRAERWDDTLDSFCDGNPVDGYRDYQFKFADLEIGKFITTSAVLLLKRL